MVKKIYSVRPVVSFTPKWYETEFGIRTPNPWETDPDEFAEISAKASRNLYEKFSDIGLGNSDPEPVYYYFQPDV
ncbi:MAG: hypothetical protein NC830_04890, partial [Candidatus Omnitrophica bacterium]|nr:hypothetical protein [Candidatus Omnitrophota bacterium]